MPLAGRDRVTPRCNVCYPVVSPMAEKHRAEVSALAEAPLSGSSAGRRLIVSGVNVIREGRAQPLLHTISTRSSDAGQWEGIALQSYTVPAVFIPRHEHPEHFLNLVLHGASRDEVRTRGLDRRFVSRPGTLFLLPRGTADEVTWGGPTQRTVVAIHPRLLTSSLDETAHETDIELTEHWDLIDRHISALLLELMADLDDGSPVGRMYGESLANALAVYLLQRYAVRQVAPVTYKGGLPGYRLKRVLDYIADSLEENMSLSKLATIAGMSPHYFSELFKQSTGCTPHGYVLRRRIERAKQRLRDPSRSILDVGLDTGFQNPGHLARVFRRLEGVTPSRFRAEYLPRTVGETACVVKYGNAWSAANSR
jgi:AraC family transcriptional regulator